MIPASRYSQQQHDRHGRIFPCWSHHIHQLSLTLLYIKPVGRLALGMKFIFDIAPGSSETVFAPPHRTKCRAAEWSFSGYFACPLGQFTRNYTQTVKRAADNKRRYAPGEGSIPPVLLSGVSKGVPPLAHDFACKV